MMIGKLDIFLKENVLAHMWYNLSAANGSDLGGENRDKLAKEMIPSAIEKISSHGWKVYE